MIFFNIKFFWITVDNQILIAYSNFKRQIHVDLCDITAQTVVLLYVKNPNICVTLKLLMKYHEKLCGVNFCFFMNMTLNYAFTVAPGT